jgi:hypothetical protein
MSALLNFQQREVEIVGEPVSSVDHDRLTIEYLDMVFVIDPGDGPRVAQYQWIWRPRTRLLEACVGLGYTPLARFLVDARPGERVERRDGNTKDFTKANLVVTGSARLM